MILQVLGFSFEKYSICIVYSLLGFMSIILCHLVCINMLFKKLGMKRAMPFVLSMRCRNRTSCYSFKAKGNHNFGQDLLMRSYQIFLKLLAISVNGVLPAFMRENCCDKCMQCL